MTRQTREVLSMIKYNRNSKHIELWIKIPLGVGKGTYYHLEKLAHSKGWHYYYLLVCVDKRIGRDRGWRIQWQKKPVPLKVQWIENEDWQYASD